MDCYRSFILDYDINGTLSTLSGATNQFYFSGSSACCSTIIRTPISPSMAAVFNPQGFKNIDVYGFRLVGHIASNSGLTNNGVVLNWGVEINTIGSYGTISGNDGAVGYFHPYILNPVHLGLNNTNPYVDLPSPIKSVSNISLQRVFFNVVDLQTPTDFSFVSNLGIIVYYKFEGE